MWAARERSLPLHPAREFGLVHFRVRPMRECPRRAHADSRIRRLHDEVQTDHALALSHTRDLGRTRADESRHRERQRHRPERRIRRGRGRHAHKPFDERRALFDDELRGLLPLRRRRPRHLLREDKRLGLHRGDEDERLRPRQPDCRRERAGFGRRSGVDD